MAPAGATDDGLGRGLGQILEQVFDEFAQNVAIDLVGRDLPVEALEHLKRIALGRRPAGAAPPSSRIFGAQMMRRLRRSLGCALGLRRLLPGERDLQFHERVEALGRKSGLVAEEMDEGLGLVERRRSKKAAALASSGGSWFGSGATVKPLP